MRPVLCQLGSVSVFSYGVTLSLAFVACWAFAAWYLPRHRLDRTLALDLLLAAAAGGLVGARIVYVITHWSSYSTDPLRVFMLWEGGMVFYGGLIGGAAAVLWLVRRNRLPLAVIADGAAIAVPLGSAIGRIGCFLNGCCGGVSTDSWLGVVFPGTSMAVLPTQLFDAAANVAIFGILLALHVRRRPVPGVLWWSFVAMYGISRFAVEAFRTTSRVAFGLSQAQLISIPMMLIGVWGLMGIVRRVRRYASGADAGPADSGGSVDAGGVVPAGGEDPANASGVYPGEPTDAASSSEDEDRP